MAKKKSKNKMFGLPRVTVHEYATDLSQLKEFAEIQEEKTNWAQYILGIPDVWTITKGKGVKVAVLDTGIDKDHPDLKDAIIVLMGDHGSRLSDGVPSKVAKRQDFVDHYSTLFSVRRSDQQSAYDLRMISVQQLFRGPYSGNVEGKIEEIEKTVIVKSLKDSQGLTIPMPEF